MWILSIVGKFLEIAGLAIAAIGLIKAWRHSAAGVPFWSESIRRLYPFRRSRSATVHVRTATSVVIGSSALVEVDIDPSQPMGPRVAALESNLNAIRREMFKLNSELSQQASRFEAEDRRIEKAIEDTFAKAAFEESQRAVVELRIAAVGLGISAFGALCQVPQIFVA
ncbi:hypothetical protein [Rhodococcus sp. NPDC055024]